MRFAVLARPGVGILFLRALADVGLSPSFVVTRDRLDPPDSRKAGPGRNAREILRRAAFKLVRTAEHLGLDVPRPHSNTAAFCRARGWARRSPAWLQDKGAPAAFAALDIVFVFGFSLLPHRIHAAPEQGTLNFHPSLLPHHRGPSPVFWTVDSGQSPVGFSILRLDDGIDSGPVIFQQLVGASPSEDADILLLHLCGLGARAFARLAICLSLGLDASAIVANEPSATPRARVEAPVGDAVEPVPRKADRQLSGNMTAASLLRRVRASRDRGGAWMRSQGRRITILDVVPLTTEGEERLRCSRRAGRSEVGFPLSLGDGRYLLRTVDGGHLLLLSDAGKRSR